MLIEFVKPDFVFENEAGQLNQLVHDGWKQVNAIFSARDSFRGGHYHKYNRECFFVLEGSFRLIVWKDEEQEEKLRLQKKYKEISEIVSQITALSQKVQK